MYVIRDKNIERFYEECRKAREDFDTLLKSDDPLLYETTIAKLMNGFFSIGIRLVGSAA